VYLLPYFADHEKFYLLHFRFWEFAAGGIAAIALNDRLIEQKYSVLLILLLIMLLCLETLFIKREFTLMITVLLTVGILATSNETNSLSKFLLENKLCVTIGKISFGLYLWHQVLLAYARYFWVQELHITHLISIYILTITLSIFSYFLIERPFSSRNKTTTGTLLLVTGFVFALTTISSFYI